MLTIMTMTTITIILTGIMTITTTITTTTEAVFSGAALLRLLSWLSPAFPLGGFAYSGGLERAVEDGLLRSDAEMQDWLLSGLSHGFLRNDAIMLCESHRLCGNGEALGALAALSASLAGSRERYLETTALGEAFLTASKAWGADLDVGLAGKVALPVAFGAVSAAHSIGMQEACQAYLNAQVSQSISAAIRLSVCGQVGGLGVLAALEAPILDAADAAVASSLDDLGGCTFRADISSLRHETQRSRLFRS